MSVCTTPDGASVSVTSDHAGRGFIPCLLLERGSPPCFEGYTIEDIILKDVKMKNREGK